MTLWITFYDHVLYTKDDFMNRDRDFFGNGVVAATDFSLVPATGLNFTLGAGAAWVDGYRISNDSTYPLTLEAADAVTRWDIVQIGHDDAHSKPILAVKRGVADGQLIEPGADQNFLKLFAIKVDPGMTQLTADKIVDRRNLVPLKVSGSQISFDGAVRSTSLGQADGVATLDHSAHIPVAQLPYGMDQNVNKAATPQFDGLTSTGTMNFDAGRPKKSSIRWNATSSSDSGLNVNVDGNDVLGLTSDKKATFQGQIVSKLAAGTPPLDVTSNTLVPNLNADTVDGKHAADFVLATEKGATSGVAQLDTNKKVPVAQLPTGTASGVAGLDTNAKVPTTQLPVGTVNGVASLDATGKIPTGQIPSLSYIPTSSAGATSGVAQLDANKKVPVAQLPTGTASGVAGLDTNGKVPTTQLPVGTPNGVAQLGVDGTVPTAQLPPLNYIPTSANGTANGVASLDATGKIPTTQIPSLSYIPTSSAGATSGVAQLDANKKVPVAQLPTGTASGVAALDTNGKVPTAQLPVGTPNGVAQLGVDGTVPTAQLPPLNYIPTSANGTANGVASLDATGKIPTTQIPSLSYIPTSSAGATSGVAQLDANKKVPVAQLPTGTASGVAGLDTNAKVPTSQLPVGAANGVASLDATGKIPTGQIPSLAYLPTSASGTANGVASLDATGKIPTAQIPNLSYIPMSFQGAANGVAQLDATGKISAAQLPMATGMTLGTVMQGNGLTIDATGKISVNQGAGSGLDADKVQGRDLVNEIANLEYDVYGLELQNYYAGKVTPVQGMQYDGFLDNTRSDVWSATLTAAAAAGTTTITTSNSSNSLVMNNVITISDGVNSEDRLVTNYSGYVLTLNAPLTYSYASGTLVTRSSVILDTTNHQLRSNMNVSLVNVGSTTPTTVLTSSTLYLGGSDGRNLVRLSDFSFVCAFYDSTAHQIKMYRSTDRGNTWTYLTALGMTSSYSSVPISIASAGMYVYVLYGDNARPMLWKFDVNAAVSGYSGYIYTIDSTSFYGIYATSIAVDSTGSNVHVVYSFMNATYANCNNLRYSKSTDGGQTWSTPIQLTTTNVDGYDNNNPCIVLRSNLYPAIFYQQYVNVYCSNWTGSSFTTSTLYSSSNSSYPGAPKAVVDGNDVIHVAWPGTDSGDNLRYNKLTGSTWGTATKLTGGNAPGYGNVCSIVVDKNNYPVIAFLGIDTAISATYKNIRRISFNGTSWSAVTSLTNNTTSSVTTLNTLTTRGSADFDFTDPVILYQDGTTVKFRGYWTQSMSARRSVFYSKKVSYPQAQTNAKLWVTRSFTTGSYAYTSVTTGVTSVTVDDAKYFVAGDMIEFVNGSLVERATIASITGTRLDLTAPIKNNFPNFVQLYRVDWVPQISLVSKGGAENFVNLSYQRTTANADGSMEDTYYYSTTGAGGSDVTVKFAVYNPLYPTSYQVVVGQTTNPTLYKYGLVLGS